MRQPTQYAPKLLQRLQSSLRVSDDAEEGDLPRLTDRELERFAPALQCEEDGVDVLLIIRDLLRRKLDHRRHIRKLIARELVREIQRGSDFIRYHGWMDDWTKHLHAGTAIPHTHARTHARTHGRTDADRS